MRTFLAFTVGLSLVGCVRARVVAIGMPAPPRPAGCDVALLRVDPHEAATRWQQVGAVCLSHASTPNPTVESAYQEDHGDIVDAACGLGGEMVTPVGVCSNGKIDGIEFGVYRERGKPD